LENTAPECPKRFTQLAIACCRVDPKERPVLSDILKRLEEEENRLGELEKKVQAKLSGQGLEIFLSLATAV